MIINNSVINMLCIFTSIWMFINCLGFVEEKKKYWAILYFILGCFNVVAVIMLSISIIMSLQG